jgi:hypothetical protein
VDVNAKSIAARPPIFWAAACGHADVVRLLLEAHANPNVTDIDGDTPYCLARRHGHWDIIRLLKKYLPETSQVWDNSTSRECQQGTSEPRNKKDRVPTKQLLDPFEAEYGQTQETSAQCS